jgi:protein-tyrosine phosphatase
MIDEYPSMTDAEKEAHLSQLYPIYIRPDRPTPQEPVQPVPEDEIRLTVQQIPDEPEEQVSEDFPDAEAERKRLEESFSLVDAALAYPRKKRKREIETEEQRYARVLSEVFGGPA